jgi:hypothetical protein
MVGLRKMLLPLAIAQALLSLYLILMPFFILHDEPIFLLSAVGASVALCLCVAEMLLARFRRRPQSHSFLKWGFTVAAILLGALLLRLNVTNGHIQWTDLIFTGAIFVLPAAREAFFFWREADWVQAAPVVQLSETRDDKETPSPPAPQP